MFNEYLQPIDIVHRMPYNTFGLSCNRTDSHLNKFLMELHIQSQKICHLIPVEREREREREREERSTIRTI